MGTRMQLNRYSTFTNYKHPIKYIVDEQFESKYGLLDPIVPTGKAYEPNHEEEVLAVYYNGQRIFRGEGYDEYDAEHIQLTLGYALDKDNDLLYIEVYDNLYCSHGQSVVSGYRFKTLENEIRESRQFREGDKQYGSLDARLDDLQNQLVLALQGGIDATISYLYDTNGRVTTENISGSVNMRRLFIYYNDEHDGLLRGEIKEERVQTPNELGNFITQYTIVRTYDPATRRLLQEQRLISS